MKIASSNIALASQRAASEQHVTQENLRIWRDGGPEEQHQSDGQAGLRARANSAIVQARHSQITVIRFTAARPAPPARAEVDGDKAAHMNAHHKLEFSVLKLIVERLTGREISVYRPDEVAANQADLEQPPAEGSQNPQSENERLGWGVRYDYYESHQESETTSFQASGVVKTEDGKTIDIEVELNMSRSFQSSESLSIRAGDALKDPLVVNFNGTAAELTQTRFSFDIDADGDQDQIAFVTPDSGFLALDGNQDGRVNDGSELFGAVSGDGFGDLAAYDEDQNQWIDENDSIFDKLRIWSRDAEGNDKLAALGAHDIGAIYLGHVSTEFKLTDTDNQQLGQIRDTSIYLVETGGAGTVQKIDLVA